MDKLTAIKIKYEDGTYSDEIPVSVLSENVEWDSTHTLVDVLGSIDVDTTGTIQDQISQLFNEKVSNSDMQVYVTNSMPTYITSWLNTNVNPVGSAVVVDSSLTISGAAADAKIVGDNISDLKSALSTQHEQDFLDYDSSVSSHGGTADTWYYFKTIPANTLISKIKLNVYAACPFRIGVVNKNQIIDVIDLELNKGENTISLNKVYANPVTFLLEGTANKLYYGSGTKTDYAMRRLAYNDMAIGNTCNLSGTFTKANFGVGIYIAELSAVNTLMAEYPIDSALHQLRNTSIVYNGLSATNTGYGGIAYKYMLVNAKVEANTVGVVTVNVRSNCTYHIALADCASGKIVYAGVYNVIAGENVIPINFMPESDCFLLLGNENNTIYYGTDSTAKIVYREINIGAYLAVNDTVDITLFSNMASFAFSLVLYSAKSAFDYATDKLLQSKTAYDGINGTNTGTGGIAHSYYVTDKIIQSGSIGILTVKVRNKCLFHIAFADTNTGEIKYTLDKWMDPGVNVVIPDFSPVNDCYVVLSAEASTMYYGSDSAHLIRYRSVTLAAYLKAGDTVSVNHNASASFAFGLILCYPQNLLHGKIIFLAGDSRSSTDYKFYGELIESKTRGKAIVGGASGQVVAYMASNAYFQTIAANPHDFSIWIPGGNDSGAAQSVGTFSATSPNGLAGEPVVSPTDISEDYNGTKFIQAIDHIIRKYIAMFYDWKTLNNGHKPRMIMCTDLPQKRKDYPTFSSPASWERKRQAIIEACEKNNIPYLDLFRLCSFDMAYEPEYEAPTDKLTNNGLYYMDGLHPNRYGMDLVTSLEVQ